MNALLKGLAMAALGGAIAGAVTYLRNTTGLDIDPAMVAAALAGVVGLFVRKPGDE